MYCRKCGKEIPDGAKFCPNCGKKTDDTTVEEKVNSVDLNTSSSTYNGNYYSDDSSSSIGWGVLGFFVPIADLILFLVWKDEKPEDSKASGIGALVSVVVSIIIFLLYIIALPAFLV